MHHQIDLPHNSSTDYFLSLRFLGFCDNSTLIRLFFLFFARSSRSFFSLRFLFTQIVIYQRLWQLYLPSLLKINIYADCKAYQYQRQRTKKNEQIFYHRKLCRFICIHTHAKQLRWDATTIWLAGAVRNSTFDCFFLLLLLCFIDFLLKIIFSNVIYDAMKANVTDEVNKIKFIDSYYLWKISREFEQKGAKFATIGIHCYFNQIYKPLCLSCIKKLQSLQYSKKTKMLFYNTYKYVFIFIVISFNSVNKNQQKISF